MWLASRVDECYQVVTVRTKTKNLGKTGGHFFAFVSGVLRIFGSVLLSLGTDRLPSLRYGNYLDLCTYNPSEKNTCSTLR